MLKLEFGLEFLISQGNVEFTVRFALFMWILMRNVRAREIKRCMLGDSWKIAE